MTKSKDRANDRPLNTLCFESPTHTGVLLSGLNSLRGKGLLLDVTLIAEGCAFQVLFYVSYNLTDSLLSWLGAQGCTGVMQ